MVRLKSPSGEKIRPCRETSRLKSHQSLSDLRQGQSKPYDQPSLFSTDVVIILHTKETVLTDEKAQPTWASPSWITEGERTIRYGILSNICFRLP